MSTPTFRRDGRFFHELTNPTKPNAAKWVAKPIDSRATWGQWEFALTSFASGMADGPELDLIYHTKSDPIWSSIGASDGIVYGSMGTFENDVAAAGGFANLFATIRAEINARLVVACAALDPSRTPLQINAKTAAPPESFAQFQQWLYENLEWTGNPITAPPPPVPIPTPHPGAPGALLGDFWGERRFQLGFAIEEGLRFHADGRVERIERIMLPNIGWVPLPRGA